MQWHKLSNNPSAIEHQYGSPPELSSFVIREFFLCGHTPSLRIQGELSRPPDHCLSDESAVASIGLAFWKTSEFKIDGWPTDTSVNIEISTSTKSRIRIEARGDNFSFYALAESFDIESFSVYSKEHIIENRRTLRSYRNVWNSCLLALRSAGFRLELIGNPAPDGTASHCRWKATQDNTSLTAANPIELLGLGKLYELNAENTQREYWWRIGGHNVVSELRDAWKRKWYGPNPVDRQHLQE